ncbi:superoxide dismutase [Candidatus Kaiserbacteria bacterium CG10_big_fil_rev_8_21_14_0_10_45_20]|uniref:superoxide dismutase n=1 Tax=Candidatus Kaiserbacteria bacterium CG10_big_fil_rev_8_21_14_0_10_45_20 TaxID=1974607 RepID=A0A2H0UFF0_9BACT|nr:MAG: superoxide dismutase [Candidatus Kaiserbacteria bacterium CG10_big_fil_rev_8_21_14_0_10_45_20]
MTYTAKTFTLPTLEGLSEEQVSVHLALYEGYVKHMNVISEELEKLKEQGANQYVINELRRRFSFEWNGARMHEYYFTQFEGGPQNPTADSLLQKHAEKKYGSWDNFIAHIKEVAGSRGIGWVVVSLDETADSLQTVWVSDHELGQLGGAKVILALDMWEHAFMVDYRPAKKNEYVEAFFNNLNWSVIENRVS